MGAIKQAFAAVRSADRERLSELLQEDPGLAGARDEHGLSLLLEACYRGRDEMVRELVACDPELDVFEAAALGRVDDLRRLIAAEAEQARAWSPAGFTPLHLACHFGHLAVVEALLKCGVPLDAVSRNPMQLQPLHSAIARGDIAIAAALLDHGADPNARHSGGYTALHAAARLGRVELVHLLLEHAADPAAAADDGRTPVALAESAGQDEAATLLRRARR